MEPFQVFVFNSMLRFMPPKRTFRLRRGLSPPKRTFASEEDFRLRRGLFALHKTGLVVSVKTTLSLSWWNHQDSNLRPLDSDYSESDALTVRPARLGSVVIICIIFLANWKDTPDPRAHFFVPSALQCLTFGIGPLQPEISYHIESGGSSIHKDKLAHYFKIQF